MMRWLLTPTPSSFPISHLSAKFEAAFLVGRNFQYSKDFSAIVLHDWSWLPRIHPLITNPRYAKLQQMKFRVAIKGWHSVVVELRFCIQIETNLQSFSLKLPSLSHIFSNVVFQNPDHGCNRLYVSPSHETQHAVLV